MVNHTLFTVFILERKVFIHIKVKKEKLFSIQKIDNSKKNYSFRKSLYHSKSYLIGYLEEEKLRKVLSLLVLRERQINPATPTF